MIYNIKHVANGEVSLTYEEEQDDWNRQKVRAPIQAIWEAGAKAARAAGHEVNGSVAQGIAPF